MNQAQDNKRDHIYLIDGSGYIFRAYYALRNIKPRSDGTPVNAVLGFSNMLFKFLEDLASSEKPTHIAVIFDAGRRTFRNDIYPEYKANRPEAPEDLIPQFPLIRDAVAAFNVACIEMKGFEADDIIATYARRAKEQGMKTTIVSSDKDLMQLVENGIELFDSMKNLAIGPDQVREKFGVGPEKVIEVQALAGDSSDNVPGVPGIGGKAASLLISEYESLEALLKLAEDPEALRKDLIARQEQTEQVIYQIVGHTFKVGSKKELGAVLFEELELPGWKRDAKGLYITNNEVLEKLAANGVEIAKKVLHWRQIGRLTGKSSEILSENADQARVSKELVTLMQNVPVEEKLEDFKVKEIEPEALFSFLDIMEFKTLKAKAISKFGAPEGELEAAGTSKISRDKYECVTDLATLESWLARIREAGVCAVDTETTSLNVMRAELVGVSLALGPGEACYIPLTHKGLAEGTLDLGGEGSAAPKQIDKEKALLALKDILEDPGILKIGQNMKYDYLVFKNNGITVTSFDDTMLLSYVLEAGRHGHGMDELSQLHLDHKTVSFKEVAGVGKSQVTFDYVPLDKATEYAAEDADITARLWRILKPDLLKNKLVSVYETLERPMVPVLAEMESHGIKVDAGVLRRLSNDFSTRLAELEKDIHKIAGTEFNIASPKQLGKVLFEDLGLKGGKRGKSGDYSTGAAVLEGLVAEGNELPKKILDWRQLAKLKSTYTDTLEKEINEKTGRVHTSFALASTTTGRLSSSDPNVQNIPIRTEEGRKIRTAFIAEDGCQLISADYSQIELRLLAEIAEIDSLKKAFRDGLDIHAMTASEVFGVPIEGMDPMVRRKAKAINFGIIYGISAFGLAAQIGVSREEARDFMKTYFERFPGIQDYMEKTKEFCRKTGYVETIFGRRCHVPSINDKNFNSRAFGERAAINAPLQGSAADIIRRAMIRMPAALKAKGLGDVKMLLQVHDELIFEAPTEKIEAAIPVISKTMEKATYPLVDLSVPLTVECGVGPSWDQAH